MSSSASSTTAAACKRVPRIPVSPPPTTPRLRRHFVDAVCESLKEIGSLMPRLQGVFAMLKAMPSSTGSNDQVLVATPSTVTDEDAKDAVNELQGFLYEMLREQYFIMHATKAVGLGMTPEFNELWTFIFGFYYDQLWEDQISMDTVTETDIEDWFVRLPSACPHCTSANWMIGPVLSNQTRTIGCGACGQRVASMYNHLFPTTTCTAAPTIGAVGPTVVATATTTTNNGGDHRMTPLQTLAQVPATPRPSSTTPVTYMKWPTPLDTATRPMPVVPPPTPSPPPPSSKEHSPAEDQQGDQEDDQEDKQEGYRGTDEENERVDGLTLAQRNHWYAQTLLQYQTAQREYAARMV
jgi:hypothetical protein